MKRIALLRAVNVGGAKVIMSDLRAALETAGFAGPQTLLQTGNVVFEADGPDGAVEARIEAVLADRLGVATEVIVRSAAEWTAMIAANPFPDAARDDPSHLVVMPLKTRADPAAMQRLRAAVVGRECVELVGQTLFACYPDGIGGSKLTLTVIERALGAKTTGRNWNTALKLGALV